jgi:DNA polymerase III delta subunit
VFHTVKIMLVMTVHTGVDRASAFAEFERDRAKAKCDQSVICSEGKGKLLAAVESASLFGGGRNLWCDLDGITDDELIEVARAAASSESVIVAKMSDMNAKTKKILAGFAKVVVHAQVSKREVPSRIEDFAKAENIKLSVAARRMLIEKCGHDIDRARSVLIACRIGGFLNPGERHIAILAGSSGSESAAWDVFDALESGNLEDAIRHSQRCEAVAVSSYLGARFYDAARVAENPELDLKSAAELLGCAPWQAEKTVKLAKRLGAQRLARGVTLCANLDLGVKRPNPEVAMSLGLSALHALLEQN